MSMSTRYDRGHELRDVGSQIERGKVVPLGPGRLPETGNGLLTLLPTDDQLPDQPTMPRRQRAELPLIRGDGKRLINPAPEELDASLWGD